MCASTHWCVYVPIGTCVLSTLVCVCLQVNVCASIHGCVFVCAYRYMFVQVHTGACAYGGQRTTLSVILKMLSILLLRDSVSDWP